MGSMIKFEVANATWTEDKVWFVAKQFNGLFCMDRATTEISMKTLFPNEKYGQENLFLYMILIDKRIYCIPYMAKTIAVYNIEEGKFDSISIDRERVSCKEESGLFATAIRKGNYLFIFPAFGKAIVRLDINTYELVYITEWIEKIERSGYNENDVFFYRQCVINDNKIVIPFCNADAVLELDCDSLKTEIHQLSNAQTGYSGITSDGKDFWMSARGFGDLVRWNQHTKEFERISLYKGTSSEVCPNYIGVVCLYGVKTVFSLVDFDEREEQKIENTIIKKGKYLFVKETEDSVAYYAIDKGELEIVSKTNKSSFNTMIRIDEECIDIKRVFNENLIIQEKTEFGLHRMLMELK